MRLLPPGECRALRAKAHHLHAVVTVGQHGLTAAVLREIDVNLRAHELIKVRVFSEERDQRQVMLARICAELDAAPVQHIGKLLVLWRPAPQEPPPTPAPQRAAWQDDKGASAKHRRGQPRETSKAKTMAKSTPQARRPRTPVARRPGRPPAPRSRGSAAGANVSSGSGRRRRGAR
jgi:putative YhbY family RNA-binding protein